MGHNEFRRMIESFASPGHSICPPSAAERWMECPGSVALCTLMPPQPQSKAAADGTKKHKLLEDAINSNEQFHTNSDINKILNQIIIPARLRGDLVFSEYRIPIALHFQLTHKELCFGTADILILSKNGDKLTIVDAKFGNGIVEVKDNLQLLLYAAGYIGILAPVTKKWETKEVELCIAQPANSKFFTSCFYSANEVKDFGQKFIAGLKTCEEELQNFFKSKDINGLNLKAGSKQCKWCPAKGVCLEYSKNGGVEKMKKADLANEFTVPGKPDIDYDEIGPFEMKQLNEKPPTGKQKLQALMPPDFSDEYKALSPDDAYKTAMQAKKKADAVIKWFSDNLKSGLLESEKFKLMPMNRGSRIWVNSIDPEVISMLIGADIDELMEPAQLKSPAAIAKQFGEDVLNMLEEAELLERKEPPLTIKEI